MCHKEMVRITMVRSRVGATSAVLRHQDKQDIYRFFRDRQEAAKRPLHVQAWRKPGCASISRSRTLAKL